MQYTNTEQKLRQVLDLASRALANSTLIDHERDWQLYRNASNAVADALALPPNPVQMPEAMTDEQMTDFIINASGLLCPTISHYAIARKVESHVNAMWAERLRSAQAETTRIVAMLDAANDELKRLRATSQTMPEGWVPLTIEYEPGYPEDVAFGPQRMMDRLKKWLDKYFALRAVQGEPIPADREQLAQTIIRISRLGTPLCSDHQIALSTAAELLRSPAQTVQGELVLVPEDVQQAFELLDLMFSAYENGTDCYESPEDQAGYLGKAFVLDDRAAVMCANLLNKHRPVTAPALSQEKQ